MPAALRMRLRLRNPVLGFKEKTRPLQVAGSKTGWSEAWLGHFTASRLHGELVSATWHLSRCVPGTLLTLYSGPCRFPTVGEEVATTQDKLGASLLCFCSPLIIRRRGNKQSLVFLGSFFLGINSPRAHVHALHVGCFVCLFLKIAHTLTCMYITSVI